MMALRKRLQESAIADAARRVHQSDSSQSLLRHLRLVRGKLAQVRCLSEKLRSPMPSLEGEDRAQKDSDSDTFLSVSLSLSVSCLLH